MSHVTCHVSHVGCHMSDVKCCMPHVTFPLSPTLTETVTDPPLLTPLLCKVGWFTKTEPKNPKRVPQGALVEQNTHIFVFILIYYSV